MTPKRWIAVAVALPLALATFLCVFVAIEILSDLSGPPYDSGGPHSGWKAMWTGDVDGDGTPDIFLSTPFERVGDGQYGRARVFSGKSRACLRTFSNVDRWQETARAGDVNGDGHDDVFVQQSDRKCVIDVASGRELMSLSTDLSPLFTPIGDVDADGCADLLVGGYPSRVQPVRSVSVVSGKTGAIVWTVDERQVQADGSRGEFGRHGCVIGDVDRDGVLDAAIDVESDRVIIFSGRNANRLRELNLKVDWTGQLEPVGDLDRDGIPDLLVQTTTDGPMRAISSATGAELWSIPSERYHSLYATALDDFDGDGVADVAISGSDRLEVRSGVDGHAIAPLTIDDLVGAADFDHDGRDDWLVVHNVYGEQAVMLGNDVWRAGQIQVISGRDQSVLFALDGNDIAPIGK